jgi:hypothetical protein
MRSMHYLRCKGSTDSCQGSSGLGLGCLCSHLSHPTAEHFGPSVVPSCLETLHVFRQHETHANASAQMAPCDLLFLFLHSRALAHLCSRLANACICGAAKNTVLLTVTVLTTIRSFDGSL